MFNLPKMFAKPKRAKQKLNQRKRSCYANTDETKKKSEQSQSITVTRPSPTVWQHLKNCTKKMLSVFFFPPTASDSLFFPLLRLSRHARDTKCVTSTGPSLPFPPALTGWAADPGATCRWHSRGLRHRAGRAAQNSWATLDTFQAAWIKTEQSRKRNAGPRASKKMNMHRMKKLTNVHQTILCWGALLSAFKFLFQNGK